MANNLIITYDLYAPGQNYARVEQAIRSLGEATKVLLSVWHVKSNYSAAQARDIVWRSMDRNDKLLVVNAADAAWENLGAPGAAVYSSWNKAAA